MKGTVAYKSRLTLLHFEMKFFLILIWWGLQIDIIALSQYFEFYISSKFSFMEKSQILKIFPLTSQEKNVLLGKNITGKPHYQNEKKKTS